MKNFQIYSAKSENFKSKTLKFQNLQIHSEKSQNFHINH